MKKPASLKAFGILLLAAPLSSHAATLASAYTRGASSQLLTANGGAGATTFVDTAQIGGSDVSFTNSATPGFVWSIVSGSKWALGDSVSFTGLAMGLFSDGSGAGSNNTSAGTFTFSIYSAGPNNNWTGVNNLGTSDDSLIGTATASFTEGSGTSGYYVNFDSPINWTANSTLFVVHADSNGSIRFKTGAADVPKENLSDGTAQGGLHSFSIAGTVVPEPSAALLGALGAIALLRRRR